MKLVLIILLLGVGALEFSAYYVSNRIAGAMDNSANQIAAARGN